MHTYETRTMSVRKIAGDTSGTALPSGGIGEISGYNTGVSFGISAGASVWTNAPSITGLTAGSYMVYGYYSISGTGPSGHGYSIGGTAVPTTQITSYVKNVGFGAAEISQMNIIPTLIRLTTSGSITLAIWTNLSGGATCTAQFQAVRIA